MAKKRESRENRHINLDSIVFLVLLLVSFLVLLLSSGSFIQISGFGLSVFSGLRNGVAQVGGFFKNTVTSVSELAELRGQYEELQDRVARYEQLERNASEILQENNRLRDQLGFSQTLPYKHIAAEIIGRDPDNLYSALVINKGRRQGIKYNMPVVAYQNGAQALVGKVVQAGWVESLVMPIYDASSFVPARFEASRYEGLVEGQGSSSYPLLMTLINKRARDEIQIGDIIATSGIKGGRGGIYPRGINIGRVSKIIYQDYEMTMNVELNVYTDFSRLEYVFVLSDEAESAGEVRSD
ncbi:MAG: rod shape-determining protein MreC [Spirochaetaceae bacterium]|jgi:rod shape-determining protein MreC|nr:rod shape-determining protein MreC [Spirochaetaceae bacterium]